MAVPKGLVGTLTKKGFVKAKSSPKKELSPQLAAAAKRRMSAHHGDKNEFVTGAPMSYAPGTIK